VSNEDAVSLNFPVTAAEQEKALEHTCCPHCGVGGHAPHSDGCPPEEDTAGPLTRAPSPFERELESLINRHSVENESDTPDFILAGYLRGCLDAWNETVRLRDRWYGFQTWPDRNCTLGAPDA